MNEINKTEIVTIERERAIVNSALWAAAGDALGWITELARDGTVEARAGVKRVTEPVAWQRLIGGRMGVKVSLPPGTYSDDTQLRLAVCRAIRGNGVFDAEAFARVELTAWQGYALGAGRGTKAAAANLARRGVNWYSNFFDTREQRYPTAGGNGAAMRAQPHVWVTKGNAKTFVLSVLRDSLTTHGHPHGFCGAVFHALALADALDEKHPPAPSRWYDYLRTFRELPTIISQDRQLDAFWRPAWEQVADGSLVDAIASTCDEVRHDLDEMRPLIEKRDPGAYHSVLQTLGCLEVKYRGSGLKTALAACALAWLYREHPVKEALVAAANELESDTDTIATMAGAMLGATASDKPDWPIQDRAYIETEASRLASIGRGEVRDSFAYPDLTRWQPPATQSDAVGRSEGGLVIVGLGKVETVGEEYRTGDAVWQWLRLSFGQTVFGKRRRVLKELVGPELLPSERRQAHSTSRASTNQRVLPDLGLVPPPSENRRHEDVLDKPRHDIRIDAAENGRPSSAISENIDSWTDHVIRSDFDDLLLGRLLNRAIDRYGTVEAAMAFVAIIAKAKITRRRRDRR